MNIEQKLTATVIAALNNLYGQEVAEKMVQLQKTKKEFEGHLIFTGMIDEFFEYKFGKLPYRSSILINEIIENDTFQDNAVIYYPEEYHFSRITDYKYLCGDYLESTTIQLEYPVEYDVTSEEENVPFYCVPLEKNKEIFKYFLQEYVNDDFLYKISLNLHHWRHSASHGWVHTHVFRAFG